MTTAYVVVVGWVVVACALLGRYAVDLLADEDFAGATAALPWVALGWSLYGLYLVFVTIAGRAKVTARNLPAALAGVVVNVVLLVTLVPAVGIAGAGMALAGSYVVMLVVIHLLTRRVFVVPFEVGRIARAVVVLAAVAVAGDLLLPTDGPAGIGARAAVWLAVPLALLAAGAVRASEARQVAGVVSSFRPRAR